MNFLRILMAWCLLLSLAGAERKPLVLISIDGLRPEFYLDSSWPAPCLQRLKQQGCYARSMTSVFPSITYANHASLVTGVSPNRHGIDCNIDFDWQTGPRPGWNWEARRLRSPALWDLARRKGLTTAAFSWPVSVGASVDSLIPEIFFVEGANRGTTEELLRQHSSPGLIDQIQAEHKGPFPISYADWDAWLPGAVDYVNRTRKPDLTLVHMLNLDWTQHRYGPHSPETRQALQNLDRNLEALLQTFDLSQTRVFIVGDHGFLEVRCILAPNRLFHERGWLTARDGKILAWKVLARTNGGSAAIYVKQPSLLAEVERLLRIKGGSRWQVLTRAELDQRHTFPGAALALSVSPGFALNSRWDGPLEQPTERPLGQHGHLPEMLPTGWLMVGPGLPQDHDIGQRVLLEVAPTAGKLLNLDIRGMESPGLELLLQR